MHVQYVQFIWSFRYWWTAGYQNSFYPMYNWITDEENSCYPNSSLPENRWYWSIISLHMHHAYLNIAQNKWVLFYSNSQGRCGGQFFPCICASTLRQWLARTVCQCGDFSSNNLAVFSAIFFDFFSAATPLRQFNSSPGFVYTILHPIPSDGVPLLWQSNRFEVR